MSLREDIAARLLQINAIKLSPQNPFTWASGIKSPIYCDNRMVLSYPEVRSFVIDAFCEISESFRPFDAVSGVATAGIAHGALIADKLGLPFSYVRSKAKGHGRQNQIEGRVEPGQKVLVVEDLISTGGSSLKAVEALREADVKVVGIVAIFQYNFKEATDRFQSAECRFKTLSDYETLVAMAKSQNMFSPEDISLLEAWHHEPHTWLERTSTERSAK